MDFTFRIELADIVYGCMDSNALNYDETANVDAGTCVFNDCNTDYWTSQWGDMVLDCNGNCSPASWVGDTYCDDGTYPVTDEEGNEIYINLACEEFNFDEGDCEIIDSDCTEPGFIKDCNGNCAPANWVGDGFCDDGSYDINGVDIFFNCEEFNNDEGDCDGQGRTTQERIYPKGKTPIQ